MGVPGMVKLLKSKKRIWSHPETVNSGRLIIDATDGMDWFVRSNLLDNQYPKMNLFGFNLVRLRTFLLGFFNQLKAAGVTPVVVFSGARPLERLHGVSASKSLHMEKSARIRGYSLTRNGRNMDHDIVPLVATNVLKQVVHSLNLECHQCVYETYPVLAALAERYSAPVFTSHSDFILTPVRKGFILAKEFSCADNNSITQRKTGSQLEVNVYQHNLMVQDLHLEQQHKSLRSLYVLLRPDFSGRHPNDVNRVLNIANLGVACLPDAGHFVQGRPLYQPCRRRLEHVLSHWPRELITLDSARRKLQQAGASQETLSEYDIINHTFNQPEELDDRNAALLMPAELVRAFRVPATLLSMDASATFMLDLLMGQTNFNRLTLEDIRTTRSAFSMADPARQTIQRCAQGRLNRLTLFDRRRDQLEFRHLDISQADPTWQLEDQTVFYSFLFPAEASTDRLLTQWISTENLIIGRALGGDLSKQLLVLMLLARCAFLLGFRDDFLIPNPTRPTQSNTSTESSRDSNASNSSEGQRQPMSPKRAVAQPRRPLLPSSQIAREYEPFRVHFLRAIFCCFIHYAWMDRDGFKIRQPSEDIADPTQYPDGFLSAVRLNSNEINSNKVSVNPDTSNPDYMNIKHLLELMNSLMNAYCEINALANPRAVQLALGQFYDATMIYKIVRYLRSKNPDQVSLIQVEQIVSDLINKPL